MKRFFSFSVKNSTYVLGLAAALLIGGLTTIAVSAAIPGSDGTISACYKKQSNIFDPKGALRVVNAEASEACTTSETAISWPSQAGGSEVQRAYSNFYGTGDVTDIDATWIKSPEVTSVTESPFRTTGDIYCLTFSFDVKTASSTGGSTNAYIKGISTPEDAEFATFCPSTYDAAVAVSFGPSKYTFTD